MAVTTGLDWLETSDGARLWQGKEPAPNLTLPEGWTALNVTDADDMEAIHNALLVLKRAINAPLVGQYVPYENLLKNSQWQLMTQVGYGPKYRADGTSTEAAIAVTSASGTTNTITALSANTGNVKIGDLVEFTGAGANANLKICPVRVTNSVVANVSFQVGLPRGIFGGSSTACTAQQVDAGGAASAAGTAGADYWTKSAGAVVWREDNTAGGPGGTSNVKEGSRYSLGFAKSAGTDQEHRFTFDAKDVQKFLGKDMVFGCWAKHGIKGGAGTWKLVITVDIGAGPVDVSSEAATDAGFSWREVTTTIPLTASSISVAFIAQGNSGDVYYLSQPMCGTGNFLGQGNYMQPRGEQVDALSGLVLVAYNNSSFTFPVLVSGDSDSPGATTRNPLTDTAALGGSVGTDWAIRLRPAAESAGAIAPTIRSIKVQMRARAATITRNRTNAYWPLRIQCQVGGTLGTATFKVSANSSGTGFLAFSSIQTSPVGGVMQWGSGTYSGDANNAYVKNQIFTLGAATYVAGDAWDVATDGTVTHSVGVGPGSVTPTLQTQRVQWGIRDRNVVVAGQTPVEGMFIEAKVAGALESQTTWVQLDQFGDGFLYGSSMAMPLTEFTLNIVGYVLS